MAFDVNQVWNAANADCAELSWVGIPEVGYINLGTSAFDLMKDLKGIRKQREMMIDSTAAQETIAAQAKARKQCKKISSIGIIQGGLKKHWAGLHSNLARQSG
jgi:hypothetical protein